MGLCVWFLFCNAFSSDLSGFAITSLRNSEPIASFQNVCTIGNILPVGLK